MIFWFPQITILLEQLSFNFVITLIVFPVFDLKKGTFFPSTSHLSRNSEFRLKLAHKKTQWKREPGLLQDYNKRTHVSLRQFNKTFTTAVKYFHSYF